jgi:hypothetical protein
MDDLIKHLVNPFLSHPDECSHNIIEQNASVMVELIVHEEDKESFTDEARFSVQHILSLASGNKKPIVQIVDSFTEEVEEESSDSSSDSSEDSADETAEESNTDEDEQE